jgi:hypothetical protein
MYSAQFTAPTEHDGPLSLSQVQQREIQRWRFGTMLSDRRSWVTCDNTAYQIAIFLVPDWEINSTLA